MHRLHIQRGTALDRNPVAMGNDAMNDILRHAALPQKLRRFQTVLCRIQLEINVVQKADNSPVLLFCPIAQLPRIPFHHSLYGKRMLDMERIFVIFL